MEQRNEKIIWTLLNTLRGSSLSQEDTLSITLALLAWNKASATKQAPTGLSLLENESGSPQQLAATLRQLASELQNQALEYESIKLSQLQGSVLSATIAEILRMQDAGMLDTFDPSDAILQLKDRMGAGGLDENLCKFAVELLGNICGKKVYLPWETSGQFIGRVAQRGAHANAESAMASSTAELVSAILGLDSKITTSDPLRNPSFIQQGKLQKFDATLCMPPLGVKVDKNIVEHDLFGRFHENSTQLSTIALQHVIAQTIGKIVFITSNSILFGAGYEKALRERLLNEKLIEAVIALPAGLMSTTTLPLTILLLNTSKQNDSVRFVDANNREFYQQGVRSKSSLIATDDLLGMALNGADGRFVKNVMVSEILKNDAQLQVGRYVRDETAQEVDEQLRNQPRVALDELVDFIKPIAAVISDEGLPAFEVQAADIPEFGYICSAAKSVKINPDSKKTADLILRQNDIVLIIKGSIGKVGIVGTNTNGQNWLVGQSAVVLRTKSSAIDARALALFLRSALGASMLRGLASGTAQPFIQLKELTKLSIPIPSLSEGKIYGDNIDKEEAIQMKIRELRESLNELTPPFWQH